METMTNGQARYRRILLKLSGEALSAGEGGIVNEQFVREIAAQLKKCMALGVQIGIIVGAGNIWRGRQGDEMDRTTADYMGMLATVINALAVSDALEKEGVETRVLTSMLIAGVGEVFNYKNADRYLKEGNENP